MATGVRRERAVFVGSLFSGYVTGFCAACAEWVKVQRAVAGRSAGVLGRAGGARISSVGGVMCTCVRSLVP